MSDVKQDNGSELETDTGLTEEPKAEADTETDTDGELFTSEQNSSEDLDLEVVEPKAKPDVSAAKEKQKDAWLGKILNNEATVDDLPKNMQWLKVPLLKELKALDTAPDVERIVEKKMREKEEATLFSDLKAKVSVMDLSKSQRAELSAEFKDLASSGMSKAKALVKAMKISGIQLDSHDRDLEELKRSMAIPKGGSAPQETDDKDPEKILKKYNSSKDRVAHWEKIRKGNRM